MNLDLFTLHWAVGAHQIDDRARAIGLELDDEVLGRCPVGNAPQPRCWGVAHWATPQHHGCGALPSGQRPNTMIAIATSVQFE